MSTDCEKCAVDQCGDKHHFILRAPSGGHPQSQRRYMNPVQFTGTLCDLQSEDHTSQVKKKLQVQTHTHLGVFSRVQYTQPHLFRRVHHPLNEVCHPITTLYTGRDVIFVTPANTQHKFKKKMFQVSSYIFS